MFEQAFKNIDDVLWKEAGCASELDYIEQTSWLLFLPYLDALEQDRADEAELQTRVGTPALQRLNRALGIDQPAKADGTGGIEEVIVAPGVQWGVVARVSPPAPSGTRSGEEKGIAGESAGGDTRATAPKPSAWNRSTSKN